MIKNMFKKLYDIFFIDGDTVGFATSPVHHEENEEEMLRRAIAMSLEEQEEELPFGTGLILKDDIAKSQRVVIKKLQRG